MFNWEIVSEVGAQVASLYARRIVTIMMSFGTPIVSIILLLLYAIGAINSWNVAIQFAVVASTMTLLVAFGLGVYTGTIVGLWAGVQREWRDTNLPTVKIRRLAWQANLVLLLPLFLYAIVTRTPLGVFSSLFFSVPIAILSSMFASRSVAHTADWIEEQFYRFEEMTPEEFDEQEAERKRRAAELKRA